MNLEALREVLLPLKGRRLEGLVRHSWWPPDVVSERFKVERPDCFSLTCGPLELALDSGVSLMLASDPGQSGIVAWTRPCGRDREAQDDFLIEAYDSDYSRTRWSRLIGRAIHGHSLLRLVDPSPMMALRPSVVGLTISFGYGMHLLASHGLHDGSDDFSVLRLRDIPAPIGRRLKISRLSNLNWRPFSRG